MTDSILFLRLRPQERPAGGLFRQALARRMCGALLQNGTLELWIPALIFPVVLLLVFAHGYQIAQIQAKDQEENQIEQKDAD